MRRQMSAERSYGEHGWGGANVLGRTSLVMSTDGRGQAQTERGRLAVLDQDGCVVLGVHGTSILVPNARGERLVEGA
jgi:hypothetical protein